MKFRIIYTLANEKNATRRWIMGEKFETVAAAAIRLGEMASKMPGHFSRIIDVTIEEDK